MAYQTLTLENLPMSGAVKITAVTTGTSPGTVNNVKIRRRYNGTTIWTTIATVQIAVKADFSFVAFDYGCKSGRKYDYALFPATGDSYGIGVINTVDCTLSGLFIGDKKGQFVAMGSPNCSATKNGNATIIKPLYSRFPHEIRNGDSNYSTGTASGLFLPIIDGCKFTRIGSRELKDRVIELLCNGRKKILKMPDGRAWWVAVGNNVSESSDTPQDASELSFDWTEIADFETEHLVLFESGVA